jgi:hypothetical protein
MKENYSCPHCKGFLNVEENIVFSVKNEQGDTGIVLLHPELGNYEVVKHKSFSYEDGEHLEYRCPICHKKLASDIHDNLARIIYIDETEQEYNVLFSMVAGEKSTFKMVGDSVEVFGEHTEHYLDLLGMR